jgi:hypothetical protein
MAEPKYKGTKFKELLVCIAEKTKDDARCGDVKLNKLLYFIDVTAYRRHGDAVSGARYQHQPHGPTARAFVPARRELIEQERLRLEHRGYFTREQTCTEAVADFDHGAFSDGEMAIIDEVVTKYWDYDTAEIEQLAHREPGWQMTSDGEDIPYYMALLTKQASPRAVERGQELAKQFGW